MRPAIADLRIPVSRSWVSFSRILGKSLSFMDSSLLNAARRTAVGFSEVVRWLTSASVEISNSYFSASLIASTRVSPEDFSSRVSKVVRIFCCVAAPILRPPLMGRCLPVVGSTGGGFSAG